METISKYTSVLSSLKGITEKEISNMPIDDFNNEINDVNELLKKQIPKKLHTIDKYYIDGNKCRILLNASEMSTGQFIDYSNTLKDDPDNLSMLCAILFIPEGKTYGDGYDVLKNRDFIYNNFKLVDAIGINFFFLIQSKVYTDVTLEYLERKARKQLRKEKESIRVKSFRERMKRLKDHLIKNGPGLY